MKLAALLVVGLTQTATAQPVDLGIAPGAQIYVSVDDGGTVLAGSLVELSPGSIAILMRDGPRFVPFQDVTRIERPGDPTIDGAVRGASILGGLCVLNCGQGVNSAQHYAQVVLTNAAIGAVIGWWFDHRHVGRTTIYRRKR